MKTPAFIRPGTILGTVVLAMVAVAALTRLPKIGPVPSGKEILGV